MRPLVAVLFICFHFIFYCRVKGRIDNISLSNDIHEKNRSADNSFFKHSPCLELRIGVWAGVSGSVRAWERTCIRFTRKPTFQPADVVEGATEGLQAEPWQLMLISLDFITDEPSLFLQSLLGPPLVAAAVQRRTRPAQDGTAMVARPDEKQHAPKNIPPQSPVFPSPLEYFPHEGQQQQEEEDYQRLDRHPAPQLGGSSMRTTWPRLTREPQLEEAVIAAAKATEPVGILQLSSCRVLLVIEGDLPCDALQASCRAAATVAATLGHVDHVSRDGTDVPDSSVGDPDQSHTDQSRTDHSDPDQLEDHGGSSAAAEVSCNRAVEVRIRDSVVRLRAVHNNLNGSGAGNVDGNNGEEGPSGAGWVWEHVVPPTRAELGITCEPVKAAFAAAARTTVVPVAAGTAIGSGVDADAQIRASDSEDAGDVPSIPAMAAAAMTEAEVPLPRAVSMATTPSTAEGKMAKAAMEVEVRLRRHTFLCGSSAALAAELSYMETRSQLLLPYSRQSRQEARLSRPGRQAAQARFRGHGGGDGNQMRNTLRSSASGSRTLAAAASYSSSRPTEPAVAASGRGQGTASSGGGHNEDGIVAQNNVAFGTATTVNSNTTTATAASVSVVAMVAVLLACVFWRRGRQQSLCVRNDADVTRGPPPSWMASTLDSAVDTVTATVPSQAPMETATVTVERDAPGDGISHRYLMEAPLELLATITDTISDAGGALGGGGGGGANTPAAGGTGTGTGTGTSTGTNRRILAGALAGMHLAIPRISSTEMASPREAGDGHACGLRAAVTDGAGAWSPGGSSWAAVAAAVSEQSSPPPLLFGAKAGAPTAVTTAGVEAGNLLAGPTAGLAAAAGPVSGLFHPLGPAEGMLPTQDIPECPEEEERQAGANGSGGIAEASEATRTSAVRSGVGGIGSSDGYGGQVRSCLSGLVLTVGGGVGAAAAASATVTDIDGRGSGGAACAIASGETWPNSSVLGTGGVGLAQAYTSGRGGGGDGSGMLDRIWQMQEALLAAPALESSGGLVSARDVIVDTNCVLGRGSYTMTCKGRWRGADVAVKIIMYDRGTSRKLHSELLPCGATSHPNVIGTLLHFYVQMPPSLQLSTSTSTHFAHSGINTPSPASGAHQVFQVSKLDPPVPDALSSELMYRFSSNTLSNQLPYSHTLDASGSGLPDLGLGSPSLPHPLRVHGISRLGASTGELSGGGADGPGAGGYPTAAQGPRKLYGEMLPAAVFPTSAAMSAHPLSESDSAYSHSAMMLHSSIRQPRPFAAHGRLAAEALGPLYFPQPEAAGSSGLRFASPPAGKGRQATHEAGRTNDSWELPLLSRAQPPTEDSSGRPRRDPTLLEKFSALPANSSDGVAAVAAAGTGTGGTDDTITLAKAVDLTAAVSVAPGRPLDSVPPPLHPHQSPLAAAVVTARSPVVAGDRAPSALALEMDSSSGRHEDITLSLEVSELPSPLPSQRPPVRAAALTPLTLSPTPRTVVGPLNAAANTANTANTAIVTAKSATAIAMAASKLAVSTELGSTPEGGWPNIGLTPATAGSHSNTVQATSTEPPGSQSPRIVQQAQTVRSLDPHIPLLCRTGGGGSKGHSAGMCGAVTINAHCPSFQSRLQSPFMLQSRVPPLTASPRAVVMPMRTHGLNGPVGWSTASGRPEAAPYIPPQATGAVATQGASGRDLVAPTWVGGSGSRSSCGGSGPDGIGDYRRQLDFGSIIKSVPLQPLGGQGAAATSATLHDSISSDLVGFETARTFNGLHGISMAATMSAGGTAGLPLLQPRFMTAYETQLRAGMANAAASSGITPSAYSGLLMAMASERDSNSSGVGMGLLGMASVGTSKLGLDELLERMATASSATSSRLGPTTLDAAAGGVAVMAAVPQGSNPIRSWFSLPPQSISSPSPQPVVDSGCGGLFADDNPSTSGAPTDSAATAASASVAGASVATLQAPASMGAADTVLGAFTAATVPAKRELLANVTERCGEKVDRSSDGGTGGNNSGRLSGAASCRGASLTILPSATAAMTSAAACGSSTACTAVRNITVGRDSGQIDRWEDGIERDSIAKVENRPNRSLEAGLFAGKRGGIQFGKERERMNEGEHPQNAAVEPTAQTSPDAPIATSLVPLLPCVPTGPPLPDGISIPASEAAGGSSPTATAVQLPLVATTPAVAMATSATRMLKHGRQRRSQSFHHRSGVSRPRSRLCLQTVGEVLLSQAATEPVQHGSPPAASSRRRWSSMCPSIGNLAVGSNDSTGGDVDVASDDFGADVGGDGGVDDSDIHVVPAATSTSCAGGGLVSECRFQLDSSSSGGPNSRARYGGGGPMVLDVRAEHSSSTFTIDEDDLGGTFSGLMGNIGGSGDGAATASVVTLSDAAGPLDLAVAIDGCNRRTDVRPGIANSRTTAAAAAQPFAAATKGVEAPYQPPLGGAGCSTSATPAVGQGFMVMNLGRSRKTAKKPPYESKASKVQQQRPRDRDGGGGGCAANTPVPHEQYCTCGDFGTQAHHSAPHLTSTGDLPLADVMSQHSHSPMVQVKVESLLLPPPAVPGGTIAGVTAPVVLSLPAQPQPQPALGTSGSVGSDIGLSNLAVSPLSFDPWKSGNSAYLNVQASVGPDAVIGAGGGGGGGDSGGSGTATVPNVAPAPVSDCPAAAPAPAPTPVPEAFCATAPSSKGAGGATTYNTVRKASGIGLPGSKSDGHTLGSPEMVSTANSDFGEGSNNGRGLRLYTLLTPIPTAMATPHLTRRSESGPRGPDSNCAGVGPCTAGSETLSSLKGPHAVVVRALTGIRLHQEKVRSYRSNINGCGSSYGHRLALLPQGVATALAANAAGGRSTSAPPTNASQALSYAALRTMLGDAERGDSSGSRWMSAPRRSASAHSELHDVPEASPLPYDDDPLGRPGGGGVTVATAAAAKVDTLPLNKSFGIELLPLPGSGVNTTCSRNRDQNSEYLATASAAARYNGAANAVPRALGASYPTSGLLPHPPPLQQPETPGHRWSLGNTSVVPPRRTSYNNGSSRYAPTAVVAGGPAAAARANEQRKSMPPASVSGRALSSAPPLPPAPSPPVSPSRLVCSQSAGSTHHNTTPTAPPPLFVAPAAAPLHSAGPYGTVIPGSYSSVLQLYSSQSLLENPSVTARAPCLSALAWLQSSLACGGPGSLGIVVQELASGGSLRDLRLRLGPPGEPVEMRVLLRLARQVASGLAHLHSQRLVHGDLRAANVLLAPAPEGALGLRAMLSDYGYSRLLLTGRRTLQPRPHGAPTHLAPESWAETSPSRAADIFAFGVLLWELAAGQLPWNGLNLNQIMTKVVLEDLRPPMPEWLPRGYVHLVQACWSRRPQSRPDVAGVRQWLDELLMELPPPPLSSRLPGADLRSPGSMVLLPYTDGGATVAVSRSDDVASGRPAAAIPMADHIMDLLVAHKPPQPTPCRTTTGSRGWQEFGTAPGVISSPDRDSSQCEYGTIMRA